MKFKLISPHYVSLDNKETFFEQKETSRETNETATHRMACHRYLDPRDPTQWNWDPVAGRYRRPGSFKVAMGEEGELVLTNKKEGNPFELVYTGPLTSEMEGMDDESRKIIAKIIHEQLHPIHSLPATGPNVGGNIVQSQ